jgi:hypothetical protein
MTSSREKRVAFFGNLFPDDWWAYNAAVSVENLVHICFRGHQRSKRGGVLGGIAAIFC